jgi:hypothetical protein
LGNAVSNNCPFIADQHDYFNRTSLSQSDIIVQNRPRRVKKSKLLGSHLGKTTMDTWILAHLPQEAQTAEQDDALCVHNGSILVPLYSVRMRQTG